VNPAGLRYDTAMRLLSILIIVAALLVAGAKPGLAQLADGTVETPALQLERWDAEAVLIEQLLEQSAGEIGEIETREIDGFRATLEAQRAAIPVLSAQAQADLSPLLVQMDALGDMPELPGGEDAALVEERARLAERISVIESRLKRADQADVRAAALLSRLSELRRQLFTRELLTHGPAVYELGAIGRASISIGQVAMAIKGESVERIAVSRMDGPLVVRLLFMIALIGVALFLVLGVKRVVLRRVMRPAGPEAPHKRRVIAGIVVTLVRLLMPAIALFLTLVAVWNSGVLGPLGEDLLRGLGGTVLVVIGAYALGGAFYAPHAPQLRLSALSESSAVAAHRWLMALAAVVGLDRVLVVRGEALGLAIEALSLLNTGLLVLGSIAVWGFVGHMAKPKEDVDRAAGPRDDDSETEAGGDQQIMLAPLLIAGARILGRGAAVLAPVLALMGYFAASRFIFFPIVFSGVVIGFCILLFYAVQDSVEQFVEPVGDAGEIKQSRIRLIPVALAFLLICAVVPVLALIWGADTTDLSSAWRSISEGFKIGDVVIAPLDFFSFLMVFSIGYVLTRIVQGVLCRSVLPVTGLDSGGRAAVNAGVGYVGIILAALLAISATGLDLSNLAIVAGALSVGIGFGLQNIVNNFVSGIILLIERPIKAGDWVELASGSGYVKQVNVRSTEIQTFDRASLFVPNSELISGAVTNWTHSDMNGRLIVPIGVAYGTDLKQVETILTEIAGEHTMLLRRPAPYVLLRRFGADAVEFEIRGVLRDVNWILNVTSDINFEIARRFAEAGIEIPFAQRDLHLRNADEVGRSIGDGIKRWGGEAPKAEISQTTVSKRQNTGRSEAAGNEPDGDT
jgi:small-conductance mechanosensitive channel